MLDFKTLKKGWVKKRGPVRPIEKITAPTPRSIREIPYDSVLASSLGKRRKSTAKMQFIVIRDVKALKLVMNPFLGFFISMSGGF
jgi:hypothetical protein